MRSRNELKGLVEVTEDTGDIGRFLPIAIRIHDAGRCRFALSRSVNHKIRPPARVPQREFDRTAEDDSSANGGFQFISMEDGKMKKVCGFLIQIALLFVLWGGVVTLPSCDEQDYRQPEMRPQTAVKHNPDSDRFQPGAGREAPCSPGYYLGSDGECLLMVCGPATSHCWGRRLKVTCNQQGSQLVGVEDCYDNDDPCVIGDYCANGECQAGQMLDCDDDNPCTDDSCDPATGECVNEYNSAPCTDNLACTLADQCVKGECVGDDYCDCKSDADCAGFVGDGDICAGPMYCAIQGGRCVHDFDQAVTCTADTACATYQCDQDIGGCVATYEAEGTPCPDGDGEVCTEGRCDAEGQCLKKPVDCNDNNDCSDNVCVEGTGCVTTLIEGECDDANFCSTSSHCVAVFLGPLSGYVGYCLAVEFADCDDGDPTTVDACYPAIGCVNNPGPNGPDVTLNLPEPPRFRRYCPQEGSS